MENSYERPMDYPKEIIQEVKQFNKNNKKIKETAKQLVYNQ